MSFALPPSIILVRVSSFLFRLHSDGTFCAFFEDTFFCGLHLFGHTFCTPHLSLRFVFDVCSCVLKIVRLICVRLHIRIVVGGNRSAQRTPTREHTVITALISMFDVRNHSRALLYYFAHNGKSIFFFRFSKRNIQVKRDARLNGQKPKRRNENATSLRTFMRLYFCSERNE